MPDYSGRRAPNMISSQDGTEARLPFAFRRARAGRCAAGASADLSA